MESPEWVTVGKSLDAVYAMHDEATTHYCKQRWEKLLKALRRIEIAAQKAQRAMILPNGALSNEGMGHEK